MGDTFCALCGVPFDVQADLYEGRLEKEDVAWSQSFIACESWNWWCSSADLCSEAEIKSEQFC